MKAIADKGTGVIVMLRRQESSEDLLRTMQSADQTMSNKHTLKDYGIGAQILRDLGVTKMHLMAEPRKISSMAGFGLEVLKFISPGND